MVATGNPTYPAVFAMEAKKSGNFRSKTPIEKFFKKKQVGGRESFLTSPVRMMMMMMMMMRNLGLQ